MIPQHLSNIIWAYSKFGLRPMPSTLDALKQVSGGLIRKMSSQEVANTLYGICICICICICRTNDDWVAWLTEAFLFYYVPALSSVRISTVFQHCRRAFLLCSSTQCCTQCTQCCALLRRNACTQCWNAVSLAEYVVKMRASPLGVAEYVVKMRATLDEAVDENLNTLLHPAVRVRSTCAVQKLLHHGAEAGNWCKAFPS